MIKIDQNSPSSGVLEIKCPAVIKYVSPYYFDKILSAKQKSFCLVNKASGPTLKRNHSYYHQIQF